MRFTGIHISGMALLSAALLAGGCSGGGSDNDGGGGVPNPNGTTRDSSFARGVLPNGTITPLASCTSGGSLEGGRNYRVEIPSRVDNEPIVFQVFEPDQFDCAKKHVLILEGHGYSGSRQTSETPGGTAALGGGASIAELTSKGYTVISIDQRGHGESGGTVRVMDPDFEGNDLIAIVDWAEQHFDYLAYRDRNLLLGSIGGSYGGMYQFLLWGKDPDHRLDAIVPEIAPHDLTYSLTPGGVVKSYWALALAGAGEANTGLGQDPFIRATLLEGAITNSFPGAALPFFAYHSMSYFCSNPRGLVVDQDGDTGEYLLDPITGLLPVTADGEYVVKTPTLGSIPRVDALIFQGPRDDLFNFNEAYRNYQCLQRGGGDVRLLTYEFGHHFLSPNLGLVQEAVNTQTLPLGRNCGPVNAGAATLAWFDEKLRGIGNADSAITTGRNICYSLTEGEGVQVPSVTVGGTNFPVELPGGLPVAVPIGSLVPTIVPLTTVGEGGEVVAGIPTASLTLSRGDQTLDDLCLDSSDPILHLGTCDSTVFVGIGVIKLGSVIPVLPELLEEQVIPLRGLGQFEIELAGVAERVAAGDQIVLLLYGAQDGFIATTSRDLTTPVVTVTGSVRVPLLGPLPALPLAGGGGDGSGGPTGTPLDAALGPIADAAGGGAPEIPGAGGGGGATPISGQCLPGDPTGMLCAP